MHGMTGRWLARSVGLALAGGAMATTAMATTAMADAWPRWQVTDDGTAEIYNGGTAFGVECAPGDADVTLTLTAPDAPAPTPGTTAIIQVSTRSDAYPIDGTTDIDTFLRAFDPDGSGRYVSTGTAVELQDLIDSLRAGLNLIVGIDTFERAERYTLVGSSAAIERVLTACGID